MTKLFAAIALSVALPAIAHAQSAPAAKSEKMACKMDCCKDKAGAAAKANGGHAGHDMKSGTAPQADPHQNHQR